MAGLPAAAQPPGALPADRVRWLLLLQAQDQQIVDLQRRLAQLARQVNDRSALEAAQAALRAAQARARQAERQQREHEWALSDTEEKIKDREGRLYGGKGSPRDLLRLQEEVEHLRAQRGHLEEQVLEAMEAVAAAQREAAAAQAHLEQVVREKAAQDEESTAQGRAVQEQLAAAQAAREHLAAAGDPAALQLYERLRSRVGNQPVAEVQQGRCSGCRITLPTMEVARARRGEELVPCPNCGRILYVPH